MPYSTPSSPQPLPVHSLGRPSHRRSYSHNANVYHGPVFSSERGPGTFASLGALPRRPKAASSTQSSVPDPSAQSPTKSKSMFSLKTSSSSSSSSSSDSEDDKVPLSNITPPLVLKQKHSFGLSLNTALSSNLERTSRDNGLGPLNLKGVVANGHTGIQRAHTGSPVPFPRTSNSPLPSPRPSSAALNDQIPSSPRPSYTRTSSSPIILSNGKPLKSSLKSSNSSPVITSPPGHHLHVHHHGGRPLHFRAQSSPSLHNSNSNSDSGATSPPKLPPLLHHAASLSDATQLRVRSQLSTPPSSSSSPLSSSSDLNDFQGGDYQSDDDDHHYAANAYTPPTPKAVHFPTEPTEIASVRLFSKRARPASVSLPSVYLNGQDVDTETGSDSDNSGVRWNSGMISSHNGRDGYPFPRSPLSSSSHNNHGAGNGEERYVLDELETSGINIYSGAGEVTLEGLWLVHEGDVVTAGKPKMSVTAARGSIPRPDFIAAGSFSTGITLHGTLLLQNLAYAKSPAVRFTLDGWDTTSEVAARWIEGVNVVPQTTATRTSFDLDHDYDELDEFGDKVHHRKAPSCAREKWVPNSGSSAPPTHDRFAFSIRLDDYALGSSLTSRTLWLVARYTAPGVGEWWDNNMGRNYKVQFQLKPFAVEEHKEKKETRERSLSAPAVIPGPVPPSSVAFPTVAEMEEQNHATVPVVAVPAAPSPSHVSPPRTPNVQTTEHANAIATATTNALSKFSLKNYVSPSLARSRVASFSAGSSPGSQDGSADKLSQAGDSDTTPTNAPAVAAPTATAHLTQFGSVVAGNKNDTVKLHWPWGRRVASPDPVEANPKDSPLEEAKEQVEESEDKTDEQHSRMSSSTSSFSSASSRQPSLTEDLGDGDGDGDDDDAEALLSPLSPIDGMSVFSDSAATPKAPSFDEDDSATAGNSADTDSLYRAFVQQWCFAQGPVIVR